MATKTASSKTIVVRRSAPMVSKAKFEALRSRGYSAARRLREASQDDTDALVSVGTGLALALYERSGNKLPTIMNLDPALVWGPGIWLLTRGKAGRGVSMVRAGALGLTTIGAHRSAMRGSITVGYDGSDDSSEYEDDSDL